MTTGPHQDGYLVIDDDVAIPNGRSDAAAYYQAYVRHATAVLRKFYRVVTRSPLSYDEYMRVVGEYGAHVNEMRASRRLRDFRERVRKAAR